LIQPDGPRFLKKTQFFPRAFRRVARGGPPPESRWSGQSGRHFALSLSGLSAGIRWGYVGFA
jgi:hypothetical protein